MSPKSVTFTLRSTDRFNEWLANADSQVRNRVLARLARVELGNFGDHKMMGAIGELRIDYGPGYRVYFTMRERTIVILLGAGSKKTQQRDIRLAIEMADAFEGNGHAERGR